MADWTCTYVVEVCGLGFEGCTSFSLEVAMASSSQPSPNGGLPIPLGNLELIDPTTFQAQQVNIILAFREKVQNPSIGEFRMEDLVWTDHVTSQNGLHKGSKLAVIMSAGLDDFISGEQHHPLYPCKFNAEIIRRNLPNSLRSPRAHSAALVVRFDLLPLVLHNQWFTSLIFLLHRFLTTIH